MSCAITPVHAVTGQLADTPTREVTSPQVV